MTVDVLIQSLAVVLAASVPSAFGLLRMKKTQLSIEEIRQQLLPENGKRLATLAYDTQRDVAELRNQMVDLRWEFKNHSHEQRADRPSEHQHTYNYSGGAVPYTTAYSTGTKHKHDHSRERNA